MSSVPTLWSRRRLLRTAGISGLGLAALGACGTGGGTSGGDGARAPVRVALGWITNVEFAGFWIADDRGYYTQEGLDVEFLPGGPNAPDPTQTLAGRGAEIAIPAGLQAFLAAVNEGNDFVTYGATYENTPAGLLSLARRPVRTAKDIVGARVLGQQGLQPYIDAAMRLAGVPVEYQFIPVGYEPSPLVDGQGDVYTCFATNQPIILEQQGLVQDRDFIVTTYQQLGLEQYSGIVCSERSWLQANRPTVEKFMRATIRGWQDNAADPSVAAHLAVEKYGADLGLDLAQQIRENQLQIPYTQNELTASSGLFRIDPARLAGPMYTAYSAAGVTPLPDVAKIVDTTVLDNVFQGRATV